MKDKEAIPLPHCQVYFAVLPSGNAVRLAKFLLGSLCVHSGVRSSASTLQGMRLRSSSKHDPDCASNLISRRWCRFTIWSCDLVSRGIRGKARFRFAVAGEGPMLQELTAALN